MITVCVRYWSWFRDLAGTESEMVEVPSGTDLGRLLDEVGERHPKLAQVRKSTLAAVGVEYQLATYALSDGEEVSLFPPVQGG